VKRIEAYIRTNRLEEVKDALEEAGVRGLSCESVKGYGRQQGQTETFSGSSYALNLVPKTRLEVVVADELLDAAIAAVSDAARTGELGDGKIFVTNVTEAIRIRTGERGDAALE
jgi:nitrogen regulatory protein P-II 1